MRSRLLALGCACVLSACLNDARSHGAGTRESPDSQHSAVAHTHASGQPTALATQTDARAITLREADSDAGVTQDVSVRGDVRPYYSLAKHLERAEQRFQEAHIFDFGVPADAKYTFGGWLARLTQVEQSAGRQTLRTRTSSLKLTLPVDRLDLSQLTLELRSFAPAQLSVWLNGKRVDTAALSGSGFEAVIMRLAPGSLRRADNLLELRLAPNGKAADVGLALDHLALSAPRATAHELTPLSNEQLHPTPDTLTLPAGVALAYTFEVPEAAVLFATLSAGEPSHSAQFTLRCARDGHAIETLGVTALSARGQPVQFDLSAFAHQLVRLELSAEHGSVTLQDPIVRAGQPRKAREAMFRPARNVLLYVIDTLRADKLVAYNSQSRVRTPGLAHFVDTAAVLTAARSQENWTKPSIATLLSSLFPWQHDTFRDESVLPERIQSLPEYLTDHGFYTGAFVANGYISDKFGFEQGFATFRNYVREMRPSNAAMVVGDALAWLDTRPQNKPFFLYLHTIDPHVPYQPPADFVALYDSKPYAGPVIFTRNNGELLERIKVGHMPLTARDKQHLVALYDAAISYHDVHFSAIMAGLEQRGLADNTLVVVTADHGEEFWDHGSVGHGHSLYDELLHVPLFVRMPFVTQRGDRIADDVGLIDVAPTIVDALGHTPPETMLGRSFLPELLGDHADAPRVSSAGFMTGLRTLSVGRYKLVQRERERAFLYDTSEDPGETRDLSGERPLALAYLRSLLGLTLARTAGSAGTSHDPTPVYAAENAAIDAATEQQLRALGYVGSSRH